MATWLFLFLLPAAVTAWATPVPGRAHGLLRSLRPSSVLAASASAAGTREPRLPIGRITSLDRSKIDTSADARFYAAPRYLIP